MQLPCRGGRPQAFLGTDVVKAALNLTGSALAAITGSRCSPVLLVMHALVAYVEGATALYCSQQVCSSSFIHAALHLSWPTTIIACGQLLLRTPRRPMGACPRAQC